MIIARLFLTLLAPHGVLSSLLSARPPRQSSLSCTAVSQTSQDHGTTDAAKTGQAALVSATTGLRNQGSPRLWCDLPSPQDEPRRPKTSQESGGSHNHKDSVLFKTSQVADAAPSYDAVMPPSHDAAMLPSCDALSSRDAPPSRAAVIAPEDVVFHSMLPLPSLSAQHVEGARRHQADNDKSSRGRPASRTASLWNCLRLPCRKTSRTSGSIRHVETVKAAGQESPGDNPSKSYVAPRTTSTGSGTARRNVAVALPVPRRAVALPGSAGDHAVDQECHCPSKWYHASQGGPGPRGSPRPPRGSSRARTARFLSLDAIEEDSTLNQSGKFSLPL